MSLKYVVIAMLAIGTSMTGALPAQASASDTATPMVWEAAGEWSGADAVATCESAAKEWMGKGYIAVWSTREPEGKNNCELDVLKAGVRMSS